ncbi:MAG: hypothetical protein HFE97_08745 [Oscillospiraceae bacterium]|nr:hypothetical protein [Oscillospiraceae bacterium]
MRKGNTRAACFFTSIRTVIFIPCPFFEVAFYANPDMRQVKQELRQPETGQRADLQKLLMQLQENPELAAQLKALLNAK